MRNIPFNEQEKVYQPFHFVNGQRVLLGDFRQLGDAKTALDTAKAKAKQEKRDREEAELFQMGVDYHTIQHLLG